MTVVLLPFRVLRASLVLTVCPASPPCPWAQNSILADPIDTTGEPVFSPASSPAPWGPNHESAKRQEENYDQKSCLAVTEKEKLSQRSEC